MATSKQINPGQTLCGMVPFRINGRPIPSADITSTTVSCMWITSIDKTIARDIDPANIAASTNGLFDTPPTLVPVLEADGVTAKEGFFRLDADLAPGESLQHGEEIVLMLRIELTDGEVCEEPCTFNVIGSDAKQISIG